MRLSLLMLIGTLCPSVICLVAAPFPGLGPACATIGSSIFERRARCRKPIFSGHLHEGLSLSLQGVHCSYRGPEHLWDAVERLFQTSQQRAIRMVELILGNTDRTARSMIGGSR